MTQPLVTVVLPTFNREALLPRALDSVIAQTHDNWEIVVVDDGSTDGTAGVLDRYTGLIGPRLTVIRQQNFGSSSARNAGIDAARGRFVAFLDSDDEFAPTKLDRQVELFERRPELGFVYSDYAYIDLEGKRCDSAFSTIHQAARRISYGVIGPSMYVCSDDLFEQLMRRYFIATIVGMVRRDVLGRSVRFAVGQSYAEEWLFYLHLAKRCRAGFVDEPLSVHHYTTGSLARTNAHSNTVRYCNLLTAMAEAFDDLSYKHRRIIRSNLAEALRQLGYDAFHAGDYSAAGANFAKSFCRRARLQTLFDLGESILRSGMARMKSKTQGAGGRFAA